MNTLNEQSRNFENILEASNTFTEWANITFNDRHLGLNYLENLQNIEFQENK